MLIFVAPWNSPSELKRYKMEKKISIELTQHQVDVVFDCLIGSYSCPPSDSDLVNLFREYSSGTGFYCHKYGSSDL